MMLKHKWLWLPAFCCLASCQQNSSPATSAPSAAALPVNQIRTGDNLLQYVDTRMGTDSSFELSYGNTYPAVALPFGNHFWTPVTSSKAGDGWAYQYDHHKINGIKQTHQPSPWLNDYGAFALMPLSRPADAQEPFPLAPEQRAAWFSHKTETAKPHHYKVYLAGYDIWAEVTPTERAAQFRFHYPAGKAAYLLLDAFDKGSKVQVFPAERKIVGYARNNHGGVPANFHNYFVLTFSHDFKLTDSFAGEYQRQQAKASPDGSFSVEGEHVGAVLEFDFGAATSQNRQVEVKVASSFISPAQAALNLAQEIGDDPFDQTLQKASSRWQQELGRIRVRQGDPEQIRTFYSALYRVLLFPRQFHDTNAAGQTVHYSPYNGEVRPGVLYTDNGFWDTFRAVFPFFHLFYPERAADIMQGLVHTYQESGWLPEWASPGHRGVMIGSNSAVIIADAWAKGVRGFDIDTLYQAAVKNTQQEQGRPVSSVGREGLSFYNALGYVPYDSGIHENVARSLEYAFADFNLSRLASALGKPADAARFAQQAQNYRLLFDAQSGWMRGKLKNGQFQSPFNPLKWGDAFTEGNALHYSWSVFHDIDGLAQLMGGADAFTAKLDSVFDMPPEFDDSYYGFTIHEIREMQIVGFGNYAHGNQPIQHMPYLYNYAGKPWLGQAKLRRIMQELYQPTPDGYAGDEDNGQTSAWYVFSALGFYPVTPGVPQYALGSPLFSDVSLSLPNGKQLQILAPANSSDTPYVQALQLNGQPVSANFLDHQQLLQGGELRFDMSATPNTTRGTQAADRPYSMSLHDSQHKLTQAAASNASSAQEGAH